MCRPTRFNMLGNAKLNQNKSAEMVIRKPRSKLELSSNATNLHRVANMVILGVTVTDTLTCRLRLISRTSICCQAQWSLYTLRTLEAHDLRGSSVHDVV